MRNNGRLRSLLLALGGACLIAAILQAVPSSDEATRRELASVLKGGPDRDLPDLFRRLHEQGDERGEHEIASLILKRPGSSADVDKIADLSVRDVWAWNTELPSWKLHVLKAWLRARGLEDTEQGRRFFDRLPVTFSFTDGQEHRRLFLEGDWDADGEIATVRGWLPAEMRRGSGGVWTCRQALRLTRLRHAYHTVVRTAPWPRGRAVGSAIFTVRGARKVAVLPLKDAPARQDESAAPAAQPSVDVAVLGIDGGAWRAILPWVHQGYLPNFGRLLREGFVSDEVSEEIEDGYPSPPNIYAAMTGKLHFRHGMNRGLGGDYFTTSLFRRADPVWKIASERGLRVASIGMMGTFPPDELNGEMVSEAFFAANAARQPGAQIMFHDPSVEAFAQFFHVSVEQLSRLAVALKMVNAVMATTTPHPLGAELERVVPESRVRGSDLVGLTLSWDMGIKQTVRYLAGREHYGLLVAYQTGVDAASHMYWKEVQPPDLGDAAFQADRGHLFQAYRNADELLGYLMSHSRSVVLFSDHGFGALAHEVALPVIDVPTLVTTLGRAIGAPFKAEPAYYQTQSAAGLRRGWTLWLSGGDEALAARISAAVSSMAYLPQRRPVFEDAAVVREGGRTGVRFLEAPMLETAREVRISGNTYAVSDVLASVRFESSHMANGIFAAVGPQIKPGIGEHTVKVVDVTPTILYLAGLPAARDMDGKVVAAAIRPEDLAAHPISFVGTYGSGGPGWLRLWQALDLRRALENLK